MQSELEIREEGGLAEILLSRPDSLNALTLEMIRQLSAAFNRWESDDAVRAVFISGAGERAFCSGGDIKAVYEAGMNYRKGEVDSHVPALFFGEEYSFNRQLFHFSKPVVAFMNGITMGGGYGIAGNCSFRIACENTVFAMPETGIGFFTDVGSVYHLNRCTGESGRYAALTGLNLTAGDLLYAGIATHFTARDKEAELAANLRKTLATGSDAKETVKKVLDDMQGKPEEPSYLEENREALDRIFAHADVKDIMEALKKEDSLWAAGALETMQGRSPTSLLVCARHYADGAGESFDSVIKTDFTIAQHFIESLDFYEGVRAALIHKDREPRWDPARPEDVSAQEIDGYFRPTGHDLDNIEIFRKD